MRLNLPFNNVTLFKQCNINNFNACSRVHSLDETPFYKQCVIADYILILCC